jgi:hypothetical protein
MADLAWDAIVGGLIDDRLQKPRTTGVTMIIDTGIGPTMLDDILELAGHLIDHWKFAFGTWHCSLSTRFWLFPAARCSRSRSSNTIAGTT